MVAIKQLAELVEGEISGDEDLAIRRVAPIDQAGPGDITFVFIRRFKVTSAMAFFRISPSRG